MDKKILEKYCNYFLSKFKNNDNMIVFINENLPNDRVVMGGAYYKHAKDGESEFGIRLDDTIHTYSSFYPDYFVDEFDNTWEKYSEDEIYKILDEQYNLCENAIKNGCYIRAYINDNCVLSSSFIKKEKNNIDFKKIYNELKFKSDPVFEKLTRIEIYNYYYNLLGQYNSSCKMQE